LNADLKSANETKQRVKDNSRKLDGSRLPDKADEETRMNQIAAVLGICKTLHEILHYTSSDWPALQSISAWIRIKGR
jgi:hypothetical protein